MSGSTGGVFFSFSWGDSFFLFFVGADEVIAEQTSQEETDLTCVRRARELGSLTLEKCLGSRTR